MAVVALQFGNYSNTVGAHWWNIQTASRSRNPKQVKIEPRCSTLFRESAGLRKEDSSETPRLIAVDLKEGLPFHGDSSLVTRDDSVPLLWSGKCDKILQDGCVGVTEEANTKWSDLLIQPLPHQSLLPITSGATENSFQCHQAGVNLMKDESFLESFEDRIHYFVEECDHLQGFQVLTDIHNGFGGVVSSVLETLSDEYGAGKLLVSGCYPPCLGLDMAPPTAVLNSCLAINQIIMNCGLLLPMSTSQELWPSPAKHVQSNYLTYEPTLPYHTGAILSTAIDTLTAGYGKCYVLQDLIAGLSQCGRKMASISCSLPLPLPRGSSLSQSLLQYYPTSCLPLSPYFGQSEVWDQICVFRGIPHDYTIDPFKPNCSASDVLVNHFAATQTRTKTHIKLLEEPILLQEPFPQIFSQHCASHNITMERGFVPIATCVSSNQNIHVLIRTLFDSLKSLKISKMYTFALTKDELSDIQQNIESLHSCYQAEHSEELDIDE